MKTLLNKILVLALLLFSVGWAAEPKSGISETQNQTFEILTSSMSGGEGVSGSSNNFKADFSGSTANCIGRSGNFTVYGGFWYTVDTTRISAIIKGDIDCDGCICLKDVMLLLNCTFLGQQNCALETSDLNCTGDLSPADVVIILLMSYLNFPPPPC